MKTSFCSDNWETRVTGLVMYSSSLIIKTEFWTTKEMQSTVIHVHIFPLKEKHLQLQIRHTLKISISRRLHRNKNLGCLQLFLWTNQKQWKISEKSERKKKNTLEEYNRHKTYNPPHENQLTFCLQGKILISDCPFWNRTRCVSPKRIIAYPRRFPWTGFHELAPPQWKMVNFFKTSWCNIKCCCYIYLYVWAMVSGYVWYKAIYINKVLWWAWPTSKHWWSLRSLTYIQSHSDFLLSYHNLNFLFFLQTKDKAHSDSHSHIHCSSACDGRKEKGIKEGHSFQQPSLFFIKVIILKEYLYFKRTSP